MLTMEKIDSTVYPSDEEDSQAPVELTTRTGKNEKKNKRKKSNKRRLKYTLATDKDDDHDQKRIDEETALTHLVFGDDDDYVEEVTASANEKVKVRHDHRAIEQQSTTILF
jgi:hypothetical protein